MLRLRSIMFAGSGFRAEAFTPCYGLAEATLGVSFADGKGALIPNFDAQELGRGLARDVRPGEMVRRLVSSGQALPGTQVRIVGSETLRTEPDGTVGEIWEQSSSVADGYYGHDMLSRKIFTARPEDDALGGGTYLRAGDLGFSIGGELFVTGRIKDLIVLRGVNHYPEDIAGADRDTHPRLRPGGACGVFRRRFG